MLKYFCFFICLFFLEAQLVGQNTGILGIWKTIDDVSQQEKSHIELYMKSGKLFGRVINLLPNATTKVCNNCPGEKNGKSLIGMDIIWNMSVNGSTWENGQILDPKTGKIYSCSLSLEGHDNLKVRGYLGISLFGRTQIWKRVK